MADTTGLITGLDAIGTIDRTADLLEIVDFSANTSFKVTVNNLVGISGGNVVSTSDTQTLTNKTLGNTNLITVLDGNFTLQDNVDPTKQGQFQLSGNTTGTTRTYSLPDATGTLMDLATAQTATNKTLTSPTITAPTITNATISANTVTGFTTSTTGNIYGIAVTSGVITGAGTVGSGALVAGSVGSTALATNAVQANQIATNAITLGYTQITTNFTTTSTTFVAVTGLTTTLTIPGGGRRVEITIQASAINVSGTNIWNIALEEDGTVVQQWYRNQDISSFNMPLNLTFSKIPTAGSHTYAVFALASAGTLTLAAGTTSSSATTPGPASILVKAI